MHKEESTTVPGWHERLSVVAVNLKSLLVLADTYNYIELAMTPFSVGFPPKILAGYIKRGIPLYCASMAPVALSNSLMCPSRQAPRRQRLSPETAMLVTDWPKSSVKRQPALTSKRLIVPSTLPAIISSLQVQRCLQC